MLVNIKTPLPFYPTNILFFREFVNKIESKKINKRFVNKHESFVI